MADDPNEEAPPDESGREEAASSAAGESDSTSGADDEMGRDAESDDGGQDGGSDDAAGTGDADGVEVGDADTIDVNDTDAVGVNDEAGVEAAESDDIEVSDEDVTATDDIDSDVPDDAEEVEAMGDGDAATLDDGDTVETSDADATAMEDSDDLETVEPTDGQVTVSQADESRLGVGEEQSEGKPVETDEANESNETQERDPLPDSDRADIPEDVRTYDKFSKIEGGTYDRANEFLRERTYITAREWAIARLAADFRTETGIEMTKIGENLPELVPFMTDTYSPQAVNQARASFEEKVRKAGATFLYGAMSDFFSAEELDDIMYETTEVAKFLLEVEGVDLTVEEELEAEDRISEVMREVREHSVALRHDEVECPECGHRFQAEEESG